jgi:hypothetical protein
MKSNSIIAHTTKKAYPSKEAAERAAAFLLTKDVRVRAYKCFCEQWHLTSQKEK